MAALEVLALDTVTPQIRAPQAGDTYTLPRSLAGTGETVTVSNPVLNLSQTWNAGGVAFTGLRSNITNTASAAGSLLMDLQLGGVTQFAVNPTGNGPIIQSGQNYMYLSPANLTPVVGIYKFSGLFAANGANIGWSSGLTAPDILLERDAANTLAQRNGANAQTFRVYNTFTDASNYERHSTTWSGSVCYAKNENLGTGSARLYIPVTGATTVAGLPAAATAGAGARCFVTDATATAFLSTVVGGGANKVPVVCDGTLWLIG